MKGDYPFQRLMWMLESNPAFAMYSLEQECYQASPPRLTYQESDLAQELADWRLFQSLARELPKVSSMEAELRASALRKHTGKQPRRYAYSTRSSKKRLRFGDNRTVWSSEQQHDGASAWHAHGRPAALGSPNNC